MKISVIGGGAWGTALASILCDTTTNVVLYAREKEAVDSINNFHENRAFLPNKTLPKELRATDKLADVLGADIILLTTPAQYFRAQLNEIKKNKPDGNIFFIICTKGIENESLCLMSEIFEEILGKNYGIFSGPTFASEVADGINTSISLACGDAKKCEEIKNIIGRKTLRIHTNNDIIGSQVCGAIKNVIAIGCGIASGLGQGENSKAALVTQGFHEIMLVTAKMGGKAETLSQPCGIGDLVLTCNSEKSRNFSFGVSLAKKQTKDDILKGKNAIVEGVATSRAVVNLAKKLGLNLPLCKKINQVIENKAEAQEILTLV